MAGWLGWKPDDFIHFWAGALLARALPGAVAQPESCNDKKTVGNLMIEWFTLCEFHLLQN